MGILVRGESRKPDLVADGVYPAKLTAVHEFENSFGPRIGFEFTLGGSAQGQTVMRSTATKLTPQSKLAEMLRGLTGRDIDRSDIDNGFVLDNLIGTNCQVIVRQARGRNGQLYSNVEGVFSQ